MVLTLHISDKKKRFISRLKKKERKKLETRTINDIKEEGRPIFVVITEINYDITRNLRELDVHKRKKTQVKPFFN